jgi:hypothetical protein
MPKKIIYTLPLYILNSLYILMSPKFLYKSCSIAKYAILLHTWGAEEATFEDLQNGTGAKKAGYKKIRFCGEQAKRDGLQYFWVDTCYFS